MKPRGKISEKMNTGKVLTMIFVVGLLVFSVFVPDERAPMEIVESAFAFVLADETEAYPEQAAEPEAEGEASTEGPRETDIDPLPEDGYAPDYAPAEPSGPIEPGTIIYRLTEDDAFQNAPMGITGDYAFGGSLYLMRSGGPNFTVTENPLGGNAIRVHDRYNSWDTLDASLFFANALNLDAHEYTLTIIGVTEPGLRMGIRGMDEPWNWLKREYTDEYGNFSVTAHISTETLEATDGGLGQFTQRGFRFQPSEIVDFIVHEIIVKVV